MSIRNILARTATAVLATAALAFAATGAAQADYPDRPITLMVPYGAGGSTDIPTRVLATAMEKILGQPIVIENVTGGGGAVGLGKLYNAKPDGYYIGIGTGSNTTIAPHAVDVAYDPLKFSYIGNFFSFPFVLVVNPALPVNNVKELLEYGVANPNALIMSTSGGFGIHDVGIALLAEAGGFEYRTLPNQSSAETMTRMLSGDANITFVSPAVSIEHIKAGSLRAIALMSDASTAEIDALNLEKVRDALDFAAVNTSVLIAPPGTPEEARKVLEDAMREALADPEVGARIIDLGYAVDFMPGAEAAKMTGEIFELYGGIIEKVLKK